MMKKLVSIIVPVYNVEQYLDKCVNSLVEQTYTNLEIILVDDGSKDRSGEICDLWAKKDNRIKVVHKKNGGASEARNKGLDMASGDIISFIDSDDYISIYFYERLINVMEDTNSDIVECGFKMFKKEEMINDSYINNLNFKSFNTQEAMQELILNQNLSTIVCNKIYKRHIIDKVRFKEGKGHEDDFYMYLVLDNAKKITKVNSELYYYLQREDSTMGKMYNLNRLDAIEAKYERFKYIEKKYKDLTLLAKQDVLFGCMYSYQQLLRTKQIEEINKGKKILKQYINKILFTRSDYRELNIKNKIWITLGKVSLGITCRIRNLFNIGF